MGLHPGLINLLDISLNFPVGLHLMSWDSIPTQKPLPSYENLIMNLSGQLYEIQDLVNGDEFSCQIIINIQHPILKGHFPDNPVVPGAWLIRAVHQAVEKIIDHKLNMTEASQVKFMKPVLTKKTDRLSLHGKLKLISEKSYYVDAILSDEKDTIMKFKGTFRAS
jgi:3-hydroxyacyl-[acyl-carrier-protein] dehydratase